MFILVLEYIRYLYTYLYHFCNLELDVKFNLEPNLEPTLSNLYLDIQLIAARHWYFTDRVNAATRDNVSIDYQQ
ncbi:hypothetical protein LTR85_010575 [Meristemomyces frigidus]|nr:hypothetical protein LTR85_010575 [Meristemomyces frigidus]